jgi:hypothetical protein
LKRARDALFWSKDHIEVYVSNNETGVLIYVLTGQWKEKKNVVLKILNI